MSQRGHQLARWILHQVDVVTVRDEKSYETCRRLGVPPERLQLVPDAVFANPPSVFLMVRQTRGAPVRHPTALAC